MRKEPYFLVKIEGVDVSGWVTSLSVTEDDRRADHARIEVIDQDMILCDAIQEGAKVSIDLGYYEAGKHGIVMMGHITKINFRFPHAGRARIEILVFDESVMMGLEEKRVLWDKDEVTKVSEIVSKILSNYDLEEGKIEPQPDPKINDHYVFYQEGETDLAFLQKLAAENTCKSFVEYEDETPKFYFIPEDMTLRQVTNPLVYHEGSANLLEFNALIHSGYIQHYAVAQSVDPLSGEVVKVEEKKLDDQPDWSLNQERLSTARERDEKMAQAAEDIFQKSKGKRKAYVRELKKPRQAHGTPSRHKEKMEEENLITKGKKYGYRARGKALGDFLIRAKSTVEIKGVGERFNGDWYVSTVTHVIDETGYITHFECAR